jgi:hypothetical protein
MLEVNIIDIQRVLHRLCCRMPGSVLWMASTFVACMGTEIGADCAYNDATLRS